MQFLSSTFLSDSPIMISCSHSCIASHIWDAFKNMQNRQNVHFLTKTFSNILYKYYKVLNFQICNNFEKSCSNGLITVNVENKLSPEATRVVRQGYKRCLTSTFGNADPIFFRDRLRFVNLSWSI